MWTFLYHKEKGIFITLNRVCNLSMAYPYPVTDEELAVGSMIMYVTALSKHNVLFL